MPNRCTHIMCSLSQFATYDDKLQPLVMQYLYTPTLVRTKYQPPITDDIAQFYYYK